MFFSKFTNIFHINSMASHLATWLGGGGAALGVCLGCVGGALTLAGGGLVVPVVVAGVCVLIY